MIFDYSLFPKMDKGYLIIPKPCAGLLPHKEVYDRFCSAIYMASMISEKAGKYLITKPAQHCAYVRATLAEFSSIEECIQQLYPQLDENAYLIRKSKNPGFHFLKLLRNFNIHLTVSTLSEKNINVIVQSHPESEHDMNVLYIDNLDAKQISRLNSAKYYTLDQIKKFIEVFDEKQHEFGVSQLLMAIVVQYSDFISEFLTRQNTPNAEKSLCD